MTLRRSIVYNTQCSASDKLTSQQVEPLLIDIIFGEWNQDNHGGQ